MIFNVKNFEETIKVGYALGSLLNASDVVLLEGDLSAGKTTFTKGLAKALGIEDVVTSPTFTFMKEYHGKFDLYHFDLYRAEDESELYELGLNDYLYLDGVCVIEWNKFENIENPITIDIETIDENTRKITIR